MVIDMSIVNILIGLFAGRLDCGQNSSPGVNTFKGVVIGSIPFLLVIISAGCKYERDCCCFAI